MNKPDNLMESIVSLCKRRGFVFPSSEIYGGFGSCYDFGPLGVELKHNIKQAWWEDMTRVHDAVVGLDAAILMSPKVWQASGHLSAGFADELVECVKCRKRYRVDELGTMKCPNCGDKVGKPRKFNLMMRTFIGPVEDEAAVTYLRAETCQGIYVNFLNVLNSARMKVPFGIAQIGKSFRNEITPGNFIYRMREFEQMEMQWFCAPEEADKFFDHWLETRLAWYVKLGMRRENLKAVEVPAVERAHYAKRQVDIHYKFPFGWKEVEGIHNRGDWDLSNHSKCSGKELKYFDEVKQLKYVPHVIETSVGVDRSFLAFLVEAYHEIAEGRAEQATTKEVVLKLHPKLAPMKLAVLPLVKNNPAIIEKAQAVYGLLKVHFNCAYDEVGSIGRRYRRQDEIGTVLTLTVDFDSLAGEDLTIRDRDSMQQERVKIKDLINIIQNKLNV